MTDCPTVLRKYLDSHWKLLLLLWLIRLRNTLTVLQSLRTLFIWTGLLETLGPCRNLFTSSPRSTTVWIKNKWSLLLSRKQHPESRITNLKCLIPSTQRLRRLHSRNRQLRGKTAIIPIWNQAIKIKLASNYRQLKNYNKLIILIE